MEVDLEEMIDSMYDKVIHPRLINYEYEADLVDDVLSANAGYDPFGLVRISERLARIPKEQVDIFDATYMTPNGVVERYTVLAKSANDRFKTTNPAILSERFTQNKIR